MDDRFPHLKSQEEIDREINDGGTFQPGWWIAQIALIGLTFDWAHAGIQRDIEADTTDERIAELVAEYEAVANSDGYSLHSDLEALMKGRRQELRDA